VTTPKYYVYYDKKTGRILSVTNEENSKYEFGIEVEFDDIQNFLNGQWHFKDYVVDYKRLSNGSTVLAVMATEDQGYTFKNSLFEWIIETNKKAECTVEWDEATQSWNFMLDPAFKKMYNDNLLTPRLIFFVMLEEDFDFLIRTIFVDFDKLLAYDKVSVPFETGFEKDIKQVSIASRLVFKSYKLKITYDNN
jgi:hypothetical protein